MNGAPTPLLARTHLVLGGITLAAFLLSGFYMLEHDPPLSTLEPGLHMMFDSRHIYMLSAAMIHLLLGSHVRHGQTRGQLSVQWVGSMLLAVASVLLIMAFVKEPMAGRYATPISRYGVSCLFVGTALHLGTGLRGRRTVV